MPTNSELLNLLRSVPLAVWQTSAAALISASDRTKADLADLPRTEQRDAFGNLQRARFEYGWRTAVGALDGVEAAVKPNSAGTSSFTQVRIGKLLFTQSSIEARGCLPRKADFRTELSQQLGFWSRQEDPDTIFAILVHAHDKDFNLFHLAAVIPNAKCTAMLAKLPLDELLIRPEAIDSESKADAEQIDEPKPGKIRRTAKKADDQTGS